MLTSVAEAHRMIQIKDGQYNRDTIIHSLKLANCISAVHSC